ncbi:MAG: hypothetical protein ACJAQT_004556 [Akkermansiaceae bacterium]|jgi:hypothetical protein
MALLSAEGCAAESIAGAESLEGRLGRGVSLFFRENVFEASDDEVLHRGLVFRGGDFGPFNEGLGKINGCPHEAYLHKDAFGATCESIRLNTVCAVKFGEVFFDEEGVDGAGVLGVDGEIVDVYELLDDEALEFFVEGDEGRIAGVEIPAEGLASALEFVFWFIGDDEFAFVDLGEGEDDVCLFVEGESFQ